MTDHERIANLEAQLAKLRTEQAELLRHQARVEVDLWEGRLDDLELQAHLAAMEAEQRLRPALDKARNTWEEARDQLAEVGATAGGLADSVRAELARAVAEVRRVIVDGRKRAS
ncbi:MAG: hypothetical protein ACRCYU_15415 [Nocardioides sp.]